MGYVILIALVIGAIVYYKKRQYKSQSRSQCAYVLEKIAPFVDSTLKSIKRHKEILDSDGNLSNSNFLLLCMYLIHASDQVSNAIRSDERTKLITQTLVVRLTGIDLDTAKLIVNESLLMKSVNNASDCYSHIYKLGESAYHDYYIHGRNSLESATDKFVKYIKSTDNIADELDRITSNQISAHSTTESQTFDQYYDEYIKCIKLIDPDSVQDGMHWIELTDDEGVKRAYDDGLSPMELAKHVLANTSIDKIR